MTRTCGFWTRILGQAPRSLDLYSVPAGCRAGAARPFAPFRSHRPPDTVPSFGPVREQPTITGAPSKRRSVGSWNESGGHNTGTTSRPGAGGCSGGEARSWAGRASVLSRPPTPHPLQGTDHHFRSMSHDLFWDRPRLRLFPSRCKASRASARQRKPSVDSRARTSRWNHATPSKAAAATVSTGFFMTRLRSLSWFPLYQTGWNGPLLSTLSSICCRSDHHRGPLSPRRQAP
jgi:hypothetical protein